MKLRCSVRFSTEERHPSEAFWHDDAGARTEDCFFLSYTVTGGWPVVGFFLSYTVSLPWLHTVVEKPSLVTHERPPRPIRPARPSDPVAVLVRSSRCARRAMWDALPRRCKLARVIRIEQKGEKVCKKPDSCGIPLDLSTHETSSGCRQCVEEGRSSDR